jgi:hypothetical protein
MVGFEVLRARFIAPLESAGLGMTPAKKSLSECQDPELGDHFFTKGTNFHLPQFPKSSYSYLRSAIH